MKTKLLIIVLLCGFLVPSFGQKTGNLSVVITSLRNNDGKVFVSLHNGPDGFPGGGDNLFKGQVVEVKDKLATAVFKDVPHGTYAVSVFHDENDNGELDTNFIGIPKEGTGASNNARGKMGPPKYDDAKFELKADFMEIEFEMTYF